MPSYLVIGIIVLLALTSTVCSTVFIFGAKLVIASGWQHVNQRTLRTALMLFIGAFASAAIFPLWMFDVASHTRQLDVVFPIFGGVALAGGVIGLICVLLSIANKAIEKLAEDTPSKTYAEVINIASRRK